ncbi:MAG: hypothetical protein ABI193_19820 [Minicystis sp.]
MTIDQWQLAALLILVSGCKDPAPSATVTTSTAASSAAIVAPSAAPAVSAMASASAAPAIEKPPVVWSFDSDEVDKAPSGFDFGRTGGGKKGRWQIVADKSAPTAPYVLAQLDPDPTEGRFPVAVVGEPLIEVRAKVRCKPISGKVDQACGLVVRYRDENNYYLARANGLEKDVNLYVVKDGKRTQLNGWTGAVFGDAWHEIGLVARGNHLEVIWDGTTLYQVTDGTLPQPGKVGVWTKADSITYFDDLRVVSLAP